MKRTLYLSLTIIAIASLLTSCGQVSYKKTKSGLLYKIIPSSGKDSIVKGNQWLKLNYVQKLNDSLLQTSYGKTPVYVKIPATLTDDYSPMEVFAMMKKGDSAIAVMQIDSLVSKGMMQQMPPFMKKGDKINWSFVVLDVFRTDSLYMTDQKMEYEKDTPRREKEQKEQMAKMQKEMNERREKDEAEMEKSGAAAKGIKDMQDYLASKHIDAKQYGKGSFVKINTPGTGEQVVNGKFVTVNYTGKLLATDSAFQTSSLTRKLGQGELISGLEEGLLAFKAGGKGTIYIPGFRAYGANPPQGSPFKPFDPLIFDVEITSVSDTAAAPAPQPMGQPMQRRR